MRAYCIATGVVVGAPVEEGVVQGRHVNLGAEDQDVLWANGDRGRDSVDGCSLGVGGADEEPVAAEFCRA